MFLSYGILIDLFLICIFSLFRSTDESEAYKCFSQYVGKLDTIILPLANASDSIFEKDILQKMAYTLREHEFWKPVHIAVDVGLQKNLDSLLGNLEL